MPPCRRSDAVHAMFAAFHAQDRAVADRLLADDFTFTSPYDDRIGKAAYFERCWPNASHIEMQHIEKIFERDDEAVVLYRARTTDGKDFRNAELFTFAGDRIASVEVFFGR